MTERCSKRALNGSFPRWVRKFRRNTPLLHSQSETRVGPLPTFGPPARIVLPSLPVPYFNSSLSLESSSEKKVDHWGCESQNRLATFAPRFNRRRFSPVRSEKLFSVWLLEKGRKAAYLCSPLLNEETGTANWKRRKQQKLFSSRVLGKSKKLVTFAPRFTGSEEARER